MIFLSVIAINIKGEKIISFMTSDPCDGLAMMLHEKIENYRTGLQLKDILSDNEIVSIKTTYGEISVSVLEGYAIYNPIKQSPRVLKLVLEKIKRYLIGKVLDEKKELDLHETLFDVITVSELIAVLDVIENKNLEVYLELNDS
jgi:hypothetical protein